MNSIETLSGDDLRVLNALFDPESSITQPTLIIDDSSQQLPPFSPQELEELRQRELDIVESMNAQDPISDVIREAIESLDDLIASHQAYAPAYTNRAQARRLLLSQSDYALTSITEEDKEHIDLILADLSTAIALTTPRLPSQPVSSLQARVLSSAHTHRGYLLHMAAQSGNMTCLPQFLQARGIDELRDMASHDFYLGGLYGDETAKQMSVATNPYAKMCGAIVKEA